MDHIFSIANISASGMAAERMRMEVIANNIANANTTRTPEGGPYRRKEVIFGSSLGRAMSSINRASVPPSGVSVLGIVSDSSDFPRVFQPEHPDADTNGYVAMPNVTLATEMVDLITASRAYEANMRVLREFRDAVERSLALLRSA